MRIQAECQHCWPEPICRGITAVLQKELPIRIASHVLRVLTSPAAGLTHVRICPGWANKIAYVCTILDAGLFSHDKHRTVSSFPCTSASAFICTMGHFGKSHIMHFIRLYHVHPCPSWNLVNYDLSMHQATQQHQAKFHRFTRARHPRSRHLRHRDVCAPPRLRRQPMSSQEISPRVPG